MRDFLRVILMNVADLLDEQLTDNRLKGLVRLRRRSGAAWTRSPTSLLGIYYRLAGEAEAQIVPKGGMGEIISALAARRKGGAYTRKDAPVAGFWSKRAGLLA